jgi:hypothetical protein
MQLHLLLQLLPLTDIHSEPGLVLRAFCPNLVETCFFSSWFFRMAAYACFYILTVQMLSDQKLLKRTVTIIIGYAAILAFLVLVLKPFATIGFFRPIKILVTSNYLSGFLLLIYPFSLALFFHHNAIGMHEALKQSDKQRSLKQRIKLFITHGKLELSLSSSEVYPPLEGAPPSGV